jgi:hypothetical protein
MNLKHPTLTPALCLALCIIAVFYLLLTTAGNGQTALVESDQRIYLQYARNIAQGQPYVFTPGDAPSTGSTTHLFPFVLAALYKLGATGLAFITASFVLNALFYLGIVVLVWLIAKRMAKKIAGPALFLVVLSGHTIAAVLHQTDIGFFTLLALATYTSLLYNRFWISLTLAAICGISRPEGFIFALAFLLCGAIGLILNKNNPQAPGTTRQAKQFLLCGLAGAGAFLLTLLINYLLTGHAQFMSVMNKGYFNTFPFVGAVERTLYDALSLIKGVFLGLDDGPHLNRQFYFFPVLGGALALIGIMLHPRHEKQIRLCELWLLLSAGAIILTVASSQWQGVSNDRYLAWILPLWIIYALIGVQELHQRVKVKLFLPMLLSLLFIYQAVSVVFVMSNSYTSATFMNSQVAFAGKMKEKLPPGSQVGSLLGGGFQFFLPDQKISNLSGITSPDFFMPHYGSQVSNLIDLLKHRPELRFQYWLAYTSGFDNINWAEPFIGKTILQDNDAAVTTGHIHSLREAEWTALDGGDTPVLLTNAIAGKKLINQLDIGYQPHEINFDYHFHSRLKNTKLPLLSHYAQLGDRDYAEVGRLVMGSESFSVAGVNPEEPLVVVLRTAREASGSNKFGSSIAKIEKIEMEDSLVFRVFVDDQEVEVPALPIDGEGFQEVAFTIPENYLSSRNPKIKVVGDHISFAYWFYQ